MVLLSRTGFSINFATLNGAGGEAFREECRANGKELFVWTVNARNEMIEATKVRQAASCLVVGLRVNLVHSGASVRSSLIGLRIISS